jgi:hypothetical protein
MDCRKFHRDLDDYLDDGLDFSGRFGMERHAQQCAGCGKVLSDAQRIRRMAHQLDRVKAPANFEERLLEEIGRRKALGRFPGLRRFWFYRIDLPSPRKLLLVSSCAALAAVGIFFLYPFLFSRVTPEAPSVIVSREPAVLEQKETVQPVEAAAVVTPEHQAKAKAVNKPKAMEIPPPELAEQMITDPDVVESDYVEFQIVGPDNRPVTFRWPNKVRSRYGQTPEEYYIRNVSH